VPKKKKQINSFLNKTNLFEIDAPVEVIANKSVSI
jgi:hypothetical protein